MKSIKTKKKSSQERRNRFGTQSYKTGLLWNIHVLEHNYIYKYFFSWWVDRKDGEREWNWKNEGDKQRGREKEMSENSLISCFNTQTTIYMYVHFSEAICFIILRVSKYMYRKPQLVSWFLLVSIFFKHDLSSSNQKNCKTENMVFVHSLSNQPWPCVINIQI